MLIYFSRKGVSDEINDVLTLFILLPNKNNGSMLWLMNTVVSILRNTEDQPKMLLFDQIRRATEIKNGGQQVKPRMRS